MYEETCTSVIFWRPPHGISYFPLHITLAAPSFSPRADSAYLFWIIFSRVTRANCHDRFQHPFCPKTWPGLGELSEVLTTPCAELGLLKPSSSAASHCCFTGRLPAAHCHEAHCRRTGSICRRTIRRLLAVTRLLRPRTTSRSLTACRCC